MPLQLFRILRLLLRKRGRLFLMALDKLPRAPESDRYKRQQCCQRQSELYHNLMRLYPRKYFLHFASSFQKRQRQTFSICYNIHGAAKDGRRSILSPWRSTSAAHLRSSSLICGTFSHTTYLPISRALRACFLDRSAAVNVSQSRFAFGSRSWDVFTRDLLPVRLRPSGLPYR